jgi:hypothetical protein
MLINNIIKMKNLTIFAFIIGIMVFVEPISAKTVDSIPSVITEVQEYVTNSNAEKLFDKYTDKLSTAIVGLAEILKVPATHVYGILIKQQYVLAYIGLFIFFITLLFIILSLKYALNIDDWDDGSVKKNKPTCSLGFFIAFGIIGIIFLLCFFIGHYPEDIFQGFINPEYGAIKDIVNFIK